jgi:hypothetical protein
MKRHAACALVLACLSLPTVAQTDTAPVADAADAPVQVIVEGRRPGPGVWKVSKDGHVMWVFGLYSPLPNKLEWDDARVARLVKGSQEVLLPPSVNIGYGFFRSLTLLPSLIGIEKIPDGKRLQDVVPADAYGRWQALKAKYMGANDEVERKRPIFAAETLLGAGMYHHGLSRGFDIVKQVSTIAKEGGVKTTVTALSLSPDDPRRLAKEFKEGQMDDVACFVKTLDTLEADLDAMRVRANAWAKGDIVEIASLGYADRDRVCNNAVFQVLGKNSPELRGLDERMRTTWLASAETALRNNTSTFALLPMSKAVGGDSFLSALQAKGYTVENPK